jgi:putative endopeptidase
MRQFRWILTAAALTSACAFAASPAQPAAAQAPARSASGIDLAGIDHSVKPGDDFDNYANGAWKKTAEIPADRSSTGVFLQVFLKAEQRNADLIKEAAASKAPAGSNERKIADYYAAFMDEATIEKRGLAPLEPQLKDINAIAGKANLARVLGEGLRADVDPVNATNFETEHLFGLFVSHGLEDASHNIPYLLQGGLGMPTRDYYLSDDKAMAETRGKYLTYVAALLKQAGIADADAKAKSILDLETKIAKAQVDIVDSQDIHKANNPWTLASFAKNAPGLDWNAYFKAAGLDQQKIVDVWQVPGIKGLSALTASEPLQAWKDYLTFHALNESASLLPKPYADLSFGFYGQTLSGTPKQRDRWKRAIASVNVSLGDAVGQIYVKKYFPASSKAQVEQMVKNILAAFDDRVDHLDWMTPATRQKAKAKIASIRVSVGYPETWRD